MLSEKEDGYEYIFYWPAHEVTGSCTSWSMREKDTCRLRHGAGRKVYENVEIPYAYGEIDALLLTHAHIDHSGRIPFLVANGFGAPIYSTEATYELCRIMLMDSAHIQESDAEWQNRKNERSGRERVDPLYTSKDAEKSLELFEPKRYDEYCEIFDGIKIRFIDAGHLLGSSCIEITVTEDGKTSSIMFSGDLGNISVRCCETRRRLRWQIM